MPFPFLPIAQEQQVINEVAAERARIAAARVSATPQLSANVSSLRRAYPWMSPGVNFALAKANYAPSHPVAQAAAQTELHGQVARNGGFRLGDVVHLPDGKPNTEINTGFGPVTPAGLQAVGQEALASHPDLKKQASLLDDAIQTLKDQRKMDWNDQSIYDRPNIKSLGIDKASQIPKMIRTLSRLRDSLAGGNLHALDTAQTITGAIQQGRNAYEDQNIVQAASSGALTGLGAITSAVTNVIAGGAKLYTQAADELPQAPTNVTDVTKGVVRGAAVALETPFQAVQGGLRIAAGKDLFDPWNLSDIEHVGEQTSGGQALKALVKGDPVDLGSGFLPNPHSGVEQAQAAAARTYSPYLIDGHAWTPGRAVANVVTEPGTPAFNLLSGAVDAAFQFKADPTIVGLTALGESRAAGKTFEGYGQGEKPGVFQALRQGAGTGIRPDEVAAERLQQALSEAGHGEAASQFAQYGQSAGLVPSTRKTINQPASHIWAGTDEHAQKVWEAVRKETSPSTIVRGFGRDFPIITLDGTPLAKNLARDTSSAQSIMGQMLPHLDPYFPKIPDYTRVGTTGSYVQPRLAYDIPKNVWDANDIQSAFWTAHDYMVTAKVPLSQQTRVLDTMINLWDVDRFQGLKSMYDVVGQSLVSHGMDEDWVRQFMSMKQGLHTQYSKFATDEIGNNMPIQGGLIGGTGQPLPSPQLQSELLNSKVTLPDIHELRRATANPALHWLVNNKQWKAAMSLADGALTTWRDAHLLRPALTARILMDDQASIAATGGDSIFNHPLKGIAWTVGSDQRGLLFRTLKRFQGVEDPNILERALGAVGSKLEEAQSHGRAMWDALGHPFEGDPIIEQGLGRSSYGAYEQPRRTLGLWVNIDKENPRYADALATELNQLRNDPMTVGLLRAGDQAAAKEWLFNGTGRTILNDFAKTSRGANLGLGEALRSDPVLARQIADREVEERLARVAVKTQGHPDLLSAVRDGTIRGEKWTGYYNRPSTEAMSEVRSLVDQGAGPETVKDELFHSYSPARKAAARETWDNGVNWMFDTMLTEPENFFARSPYIRQQYVTEWERQFPNMTRADRAEFLDSKMADMNLDRATQARFQAMRNLPERANPIPAEAADHLAKQFAVDQSKTYLHNLYQKSQFFDALRFVFPFGDAWKKLLVRWSKITFENPQIVRRVQQGVVGARGSGFFHTDANGNEVFTFPGSGWLTDQIFGVPVPLTGQPKNLNLLSEGVPGVGPFASLPTAFLLKDKPSTDWIRKIVFPFGEPDTSGGIGSAIVNELEPAWVKKFATVFFDSPESNRIYGNAVSDLIRYKASTGDYKLHGPDAVAEMNRLISDAKSDADKLYMIRGAVQFFSPAAPVPEYNVKDKSGNLAVMQMVVKEYYDHVKKDGYDGATKWFFDTYGDANGLLIQPESIPVTPNLPKGSEGTDWEREHGDLVSKFPKTWTFYAPQGGKFDSTAYAASFGRGERQKLTPEEYVKNANNRIASYQYYHEVSKYPNPTEEEKQYLSDLKGWLTRHYPGFQDVVSPKPGLPAVTRELIDTAKDPQLQKTDAGKGLALYLKARDEAIASARDKGIKGWQTAKATQDERDFLKETGDWVIRHHPEFKQMWDWVWSREIHADSQGASAPEQTPVRQQVPVQSTPWTTQGVR
jgi:hypothetical protein